MMSTPLKVKLGQVRENTLISSYGGKPILSISFLSCDSP